MSVNRLVYLADDRSIGVDGEFLLDVDSSHLTWIDSNIHAIQWYGDQHGGEIEYRITSPVGGEKPPNAIISELGEFDRIITIFNEEKSRRENAILLANQLRESSRDYWQELRTIRNNLLFFSDWTQLPDSPLSQVQVSNWVSYRQSLRDITENTTDPKILVEAYQSGTMDGWPAQPN